MHGLRRVKKVYSGQDWRQSVLVGDADGLVRLTLSACAYPADLTPDEARFIARCLIASAHRVDGTQPAKAAGGVASATAMTSDQRAERARKAALASAKAMTSDQRAERARKAALARWAKREDSARNPEEAP